MTTEPALRRRRFLQAAVGATALASTSGVVAAESPVVAMKNNYFEPNGLAVEPGTTVTFRLEEGVHSATAYTDRIPENAEAFDSGIIDSGRFEYTFEVPGTYDFYCIPHKAVGMVGRVVVGSPGGPAEDAPVPDGDLPSSKDIIESGRIEGTPTGGGMMNGGHGGMMNGGDGGMMSGPSGMMNGPGGRMGSGAFGWWFAVATGFSVLALAALAGLAFIIFGDRTE